ncbi:PREDICTED: uncharacterized protein LOC107353034 [Acropora digitifera]|uniref:uncharacterized protein LOC107353034 n=1 Tax=Acropora digitifera TaxID=70779 RepID=UPI00077B09D5|nr:PREDICTED: uncharacterized protein LOC107353034 [Acropora digitifera]
MTFSKVQAFLLIQAALCLPLNSGDKNDYQIKKASKKSIELETAYVYRTNLPRRHHYSVIMGSSGKTVVGPLVPESGEEQIHRVQGFVLTPDTVKEEFVQETVLDTNWLAKLVKCFNEKQSEYFNWRNCSGR